MLFHFKHNPIWWYHQHWDFTWWRQQKETFSVSLALCVGIHRWPVNSPQKGQWRGALMFSLICAWMNRWVNNHEPGDLRRHRAHNDVIVMKQKNYVWKTLKNGGRKNWFSNPNSDILLSVLLGLVKLCYSSVIALDGYKPDPLLPLWQLLWTVTSNNPQNLVECLQ